MNNQSDVQTNFESVNPTQETPDASEYHAMATVAELLAKLRDENLVNKHGGKGQQYTHMDFADKKTGEVTPHRVVF